MRFLRILVAFGALLALGGVMLLFSDAAKREAERVAALPRTDPPGIRGFSAGTDVLLEGRLAASDPIGPQGFVTYHHEKFGGHESSGANKGREIWQRLTTVRPGIAIEGTGAKVSVSNRDYLLRSWPRAERTEVVPRYFSVFEATERYLGFKAGDAVTVDGRVLRGENDPGVTPRIEVRALHGGDAASYVASMRGGTVVLKVVGGVFLGLGALMVTVGIWGIRKLRK